jgi:UDP:flavonoid glycosyltransferase YjiC (YdhE family)
MRVLISTRSGAGHFGPLIPFAHALLRDNAEVLVTAPRDAGPMVAAAGLEHHPIPDPPAGERDQVFADARQMDPAAANARVVGDVFIRIDTAASFPHLRRAIGAWRPDVVLYDITDFAAGLAAEAAGVPAVSVAITLGEPIELLRDVIAEALDEVREQVGLEPDPHLERFRQNASFTLIPEGLEDPAKGGSPPLRFRVPEAREPRPLPDWWSNDEWPLVYLTFGSVAPAMDYFPDLYRAAIDALSVLPVRVLVTIGRDRDPADIGPVPANVHVAGWVPQADVMPHAAAMVCHGGSGTVNAGLAAGLPMVVVPLFADQPHNARRVAEIGAGIALAPEQLVRLPDAVRSLLGNGSYRAVAGGIADKARRLPTVDTATKILRSVAQSQPRSVAWSTA